MSRTAFLNKKSISVSHSPARNGGVARELALAIDTASINPGQSQDFIAHQVLNGANQPAFEIIANAPTRSAQRSSPCP